MARPTDAERKPAPPAPAKPVRALAGQRNEAFEKEVDEELQREWFAQLWEQYSGLILAAAAALVLVVGGYKFLEQRRLSAAEAQGARYFSAVKQLTDGKTDAAAAELAGIGQGNTGFAVLSRLRLAAADVANGKPADALTKYEALAQNRGIDPVLADFARLQTAMLKLDTATWEDMQSSLTSLTADQNPWRHGARELLGMAALKANKTGEARVQFERLVADTATPAGMAERARIVMGSFAAADLAAKGPMAPALTPAIVPAPPPAKKN